MNAMNLQRPRTPGSRRLMPLAAALLSLAIVAGCAGKKGISPESALDTPESHYKQGQKYLDAGDIAGAKAEFTRAIDLATGAQRKFAPGYEGMGLAHLAAGEYEPSRRMFEKAKGEDGKYAPAWTGMGRLYTAMKKYDDALGEFEKAQKLDPGGTDPWMYRGDTWIAMARYDEAEADYKHVMSVAPTHAKANAKWEELQKARRALAGAPPEYTAIARSSSITRADLAALLVNEVNLKKAFRQAPPATSAGFAPPPGTASGGAGAAATATPAGGPNDTSSSWARSQIDEVLATGVMELYPDGGFHPAEPVARAAFAQVTQAVLARALLDDGLATRYIGETSPFSDVPGSHFAFNAAMVATTRGIMKAKMDGSFGLTDPVPGTDAILMIRALKDQLP